MTSLRRPTRSGRRSAPVTSGERDVKPLTSEGTAISRRRPTHPSRNTGLGLRLRPLKFARRQSFCTSATRFEIVERLQLRLMLAHVEYATRVRDVRAPYLRCRNNCGCVVGVDWWYK